jgi:hypothetical protein
LTTPLIADRPEKITFAAMRASGVRGILVYCCDFKCSHSIALSADQWPDDMRLSDIESRFVCTAGEKRTVVKRCEMAHKRDWRRDVICR